MLLRPNVILDEMYLRPNVTRPNVIRRKCIRRNVTEPIQGWRFESSMALFKWRITRHTLHLNANYFVRQVSLHFLHSMLSGVREGAAPPPFTRAAPWEAEGRGAPMGEALLILHLLAFSFLRSGTVAFLGGAVVLLPPWEFQAGPCPHPLENTKLKWNYV